MTDNTCRSVLSMPANHVVQVFHELILEAKDKDDYY